MHRKHDAAILLERCGYANGAVQASSGLTSNRGDNVVWRWISQKWFSRTMSHVKAEVRSEQRESSRTFCCWRWARRPNVCATAVRRDAAISTKLLECCWREHATQTNVTTSELLSPAVCGIILYFSKNIAQAVVLSKQVVVTFLQRQLRGDSFMATLAWPTARLDRQMWQFFRSLSSSAKPSLWPLYCIVAW